VVTCSIPKPIGARLPSQSQFSNYRKVAAARASVQRHGGGLQTRSRVPGTSFETEFRGS
jgi:hypothetical protein